MVDLDKIGVPINTVMNEPCSDTMAKMPDKCINMVMTSPPYWALREYSGAEMIWGGDEDCEHSWGEDMDGAGKNNDKSAGIKQQTVKGSIGRDDRPSSNFCTKCGAWKGQLGLEFTFDLYIKHLCDIFDEVKRILRDDGVIFVNLSDTYGGNNSRASTGGRAGYGTEREGIFNNQMPAKSQCAIPERFVIEMLNRGWIKRNTIIWYKKSAMPSSTKDRFTVDFEYIFFFSKKRKYYFEQQFEPVKQVSIDRLKRAVSNQHKWKDGPDGQTQHTMNKPRPNRTTKIPAETCEMYGSPRARYNRLEKSNAPHEFGGADHLVSPFDPEKGRNKRCVWDINTTSFSEAHFAVFPEELCEIPIKFGCPEFVCKKCGKPREKIYKKDTKSRDVEWHNEKYGDGDERGKRLGRLQPSKSVYRESKFVGLTDCGCGKGFTSGIVYDPFAGAGTTGLVAHRLNRNFIGSEISKEYCKIAEKRLASEIKQVRMF